MDSMFFVFKAKVKNGNEKFYNIQEELFLIIVIRLWLEIVYKMHKRGFKSPLQKGKK